MSVMDWSAVLEFIKSTDPSLATQLRGVSDQEAAAYESRSGMRLPNNYRGFLLAMGRYSGDFQPFSPADTLRFDDLVEQKGPRNSPDRFFRVAFASDPSDISAPDYFLDLARSDGQDAPLVMFEGVGEFALENVVDTGLVFGEYFTDALFRFIEFNRRASSAMVFVTELSPQQALARKAIAMELLAKMNFELALPPLLRVACFHRDTQSAVVSSREMNDLLRIDLASEDRRSLDVMVDQVLVGLPGAEL